MRICSLFCFQVVQLVSRAGVLWLVTLTGCTLFATRPVQEMSFTAAAIRAAKEVQSDTLAPEFFRQSNEWFFKAKHEYKYKNFKLAHDYAAKARFFAEQAEFESLRNGGIRSDQAGVDPLAKDPLAGAGGVGSGAGPGAPSVKEKPYVYPTPTGVSVDEYDKRKTAEEQAVQQQQSSTPRTPAPTPSSGK